MRALNSAAQDAGMRITRLESDASSVRFKVVPAERRTIQISPEARRARAEKARATKMRNRQQSAEASTAE
jgi:hypothetical protein